MLRDVNSVMHDKPETFSGAFLLLFLLSLSSSSLSGTACVMLNGTFRHWMHISHIVVGYVYSTESMHFVFLRICFASHTFDDVRKCSNNFLFVQMPYAEPRYEYSFVRSEMETKHWNQLEVELFYEWMNERTNCMPCVPFTCCCLTRMKLQHFFRYAETFLTSLFCHRHRRRRCRRCRSVFVVAVVVDKTLQRRMNGKRLSAMRATTEKSTTGE